MLKATGVVRPVDELGRIVLPIAVRRDLGLAPKDVLEIYVDGDSIVLEKYVPGCLFCGGHEELTTFKGKLVCQTCKADLSSRFGHAAD